MKPILFELFGLQFPSWHVFFALGGVLAYLYGLFCLNLAVGWGRKNAVPAFAQRELDHFGLLFGACYICGWFGARAFSILHESFVSLTVSEFWFSLFSMGSMTFYGGALAAFVCGLVVVYFKKLDLRLLLDIAIPAAILGLGVGRIGCFLNGDDFGIPLSPQNFNSLPWWAHGIQGTLSWETYLSVASQQSSDASAMTGPLKEIQGVNKGYWQSAYFTVVPRYPVQLQEATFSLLLSGACLFVFYGRFFTKESKLASLANIPDFWQKSLCSKHRLCLGYFRKNSGSLAAWAIVFSAGNRFVNEFFRGDPRGNFWMSKLSTSQGIAILLMSIALSFLVFSRFFGKKTLENKFLNKG